MARFTMKVDVNPEPKRIIDALTDFSPRRMEIWPGLAPEFFEVYSVGENEAVVREGSTKPAKVWAREQYDWSKPGIVRWTVIESNFCNPGSYVEARVKPKGDGSTVEVEWNRTGSTTSGRMMVAFMKVMGPRILRSYLRKSLNALS
jgi:hypothetical protein